MYEYYGDHLPTWLYFRFCRLPSFLGSFWVLGHLTVAIQKKKTALSPSCREAVTLAQQGKYSVSGMVY